MNSTIMKNSYIVVIGDRERDNQLVSYHKYVVKKLYF